MFNLDPGTAYVALDNPLWAGGDADGRVYAADLVSYDENDAEIAREQIPFPMGADGYYPQMGTLQKMIDDVNSGRITRRPPTS